MPKRPSFQFYPGDWRRDAALQSCSVGARGLLIEMMCLMHEGTPYGHLKVNHKVILPPNLSRMVGATLSEVEGWLEEMMEAGVLSQDDDGAFVSRRMVRDEDLRQRRAAGGSKGGNPALMKTREVNLRPNLGPNLEITPASSSASSKKNPPTGDLPPGGTTPAKPLNPQAAKVKRLEEFYRKQGAKPPEPGVLAKWMAKVGGVENALLFLDDMHGKGKLGQHSFCWECAKDWQPRRKPVQGNSKQAADFDWNAAAEDREAEDGRLDPLRLALSQAEREHGEESPEYDSALMALMQAIER